jgi:hypothetical protein
MCGVLRPGGRLAVALWRSIPLSPGFAALVSALDLHAGRDAANVLRAPFAMGDHTLVRGLVAGAGFDAVRVYNHSHPVHVPSVADLVTAEIAATPLAEMARSWEPEIVPAMINDVADTANEFVADDGLLFPVAAYVVTAERPSASN